MAKALSAFPKLTVVGAHFGGWSVWDDAERLLTKYPNFYVDTSSSFYAFSPERARHLIRRYGASRVMFATDYPMWDIEHEIAYLDALALDGEELEMIYHGNAERLFFR